jgi:sugar/nucleoside kinase (ribokinase family)
VAKTGAGDAFSAGYITARSAGLSIAESLQWGTADSTAVIQEHGPHKGLLDKKGIKTILDQFKTIQPQRLA